MKSQRNIGYCLLISFSLLSLNAVALPSATYLESWDSNWQNVVENLPPASGGSSENSYEGITLNIGFACYNFPGLNGLQFSLEDLGTVVSFVQSHGGSVQVSFGGASYAPPCAPNYFISQTSGWPNNYVSLANGVVDAVSTYDLDGVDFDIEDPQPSYASAQDFANDLISFLKQVRSGLPEGKKISITIPAQGWGTYWYYLATGAAAVEGLVDYINFMEYDIWVNPAITFVQQIQADLTTYTSSSSTSPPPNYAVGWNIPSSLVQLGIMPGCDDTGKYLSVSDTQTLASTASSMGLYGIMTWDLNRDAGSVKTPSCTTYPSNYEYIEAIRNFLLLIDGSQAPSSYSLYPLRKRQFSIQDFVRQSPPSHGSP